MKGLPVVSSVLGQIPLIQSVPAIIFLLSIYRPAPSTVGLLLVCGLHRQLGVVSHHGVGLVAGFVVLVDHSVLLSRGPSLVIGLRVGTWLPQVIPGGGAASNITVECWNICIFLVSTFPFLSWQCWSD